MKRSPIVGPETPDKPSRSLSDLTVRLQQISKAVSISAERIRETFRPSIKPLTKDDVALTNPVKEETDEENPDR